MSRLARHLPSLFAFAIAVALPSGAAAATQPTAGIYVDDTAQGVVPHLVVAFNATPTIAAGMSTSIQTTPGGANDVVAITFAPPIQVPTPNGADGCVSGGANAFTETITCTLPTGTLANPIEFWGQDDDDSVTMLPANAGDTTRLLAYLRGGDTNQLVRGGNGADVLDSAEGGSTVAVQNYLAGGAGHDTFVASTAPNVRDTVNYDDQRTNASPVDVSLDGVANDGNATYDGSLEDAGSVATGVEGIVASPGADDITGSAGNNVIYARQGDDTVDGGGGNDTIFAGDGADDVTGGTGNDNVYGDFDQWGFNNGTTGDGDDEFHLRDTGTDDDNVNECGGGTDTGELDGADADNEFVAIPADCEGLVRSTPATSDGFISLFTFGTLPNRVIFDPTTNALNSTVTVTGTSPTWTITYTQALDAYVAPRLPECAYAADDNVDLTTHTVECTVSAPQFASGMEVWLGNGNSDFTANPNLTAPFLIHPEAGVNVVRGGGGNDTFDGDSFETITTVNTMMGGVGADTFIGGDGVDLADYSTHVDPGVAGQYVMTMDCASNDGGTLDGNRFDNVGCTGNKMDGVTGSNVRDVITGDGGNNRLAGNNGNDLIDGGAGSDQLQGGGDNDAITGGAGNDALYGDTGSDTLTVNDGAVDGTVNCGDQEDAVTYDFGVDTPLQCENLTPPAGGGAPTNVVAPQAPAGVPVVGAVVTSDRGTWTGAGTITYAATWERCEGDLSSCTPVGGADPSYTVAPGDADRVLRYCVTATIGTSATRCSGPTAFVTSPAPTAGALTITGEATFGRSVTANVTFAPANVDISYRWQRCSDAGGTLCTDVVGGTGQTYVVADGDVGSRLKVSVTGITPGVARGVRVDRLTGVVGRAPSAACDRYRNEPQGDPDGDGLRNFYECGTVTLGGQYLDLPALGASPVHKDMFVEIDKTQGQSFSAEAVATMVASFDRAPLTNPDGRPGIALHVDNGADSPTGPGTKATWGAASRSSALLPANDDGRLGVGTDEYDWTEFDRLKAANFDAIRSFAFRYVIVTDRYGDSLPASSGIARANDWKADNLGQDLIVSLGASSGNPTTQAGTLMHEFGHTLGLGHGGRDLGGNPDHDNYKPNYPSVMNYAWQMAGVGKKDGTNVFDYSRYATPEFQVVEETKLTENLGIDASGQGLQFRGLTRCTPPKGALQPWPFEYDKAVDFDCDGKILKGFKPYDVNFGGLRNETSQTTKLMPRDDWAAIVFTGGSIGGGGAGVGEVGVDSIELDPSTIEVQPRLMPNPDRHGDVESLMESARVSNGDAKRPTLKVVYREPAVKRPKRGKAAVKTLPVTVVLADNRAVSQLSIKVGSATPKVAVARKGARSMKLAVVLPKGRSTVVITGFDWIGNVVTLKRSFVVTCPKSGACTAK